MSDYKDIKGLKVRYLASDPANPELGEVWYNSTTNTAKIQSVILQGTVATGGTMNVPRSNLSGFGVLTAGVAAGGYGSTATENYDGTSWTTSGSMGTAQYRGFGGGTQTAGFVGNGRQTPGAAKNQTEEYDGSVWSTSNPLSTSRYFGAQGGKTQTTGLAAGGSSSPSTQLNATEEYDGTSWTSSGNLTYTAGAVPGNGPQTAAIGAGGYTGPPTTMTTNSAEYNGATWTATNSLNTARGQGAMLGDSSTAALLGGGPPSVSPISNSIENYDGTCWSANPNSLPTGQISANNAGVGSQASGYFSGASPGPNASTFEYSGLQETAQTIGTS